MGMLSRSARAWRSTTEYVTADNEALATSRNVVAAAERALAKPLDRARRGGGAQPIEAGNRGG
jgi:hypothetical protein